MSNIKVAGSGIPGSVPVGTNIDSNNIHWPVYNAGFGSNGDTPTQVDSVNPLPVDPQLQKTAFGELLVANLKPQIQADFSYNINPEIWHDHSNNGTASVDDHRMKISTGAATNQSAQIQSKIAVKYNAGQGGLVRFTALFTVGVAGSEQIAGIGDNTDGFFFGFNGADFGLLRRYGGHKEVRTLTITTASTTTENITITLDGDSDATVAVTNSGVISTTANEIADHDFSGLGAGWSAHSDGDGTVRFVSYDSEVRAGSYSLTGSTAVGSYVRDIIGKPPTDTWVAQTAWNGDKFDGSGSSGTTLDPTKGNIYQIRYQWLGYGRISFYVEHPEDGELKLVHAINYANTNTHPSVNNPTLPIFYCVKNTTNNSDIIMMSGSCAGFSEGVNGAAHLHHGIGASKASITTSETPILTLHNLLFWQGVPNRKRLKLISATVSADGAKPSIIRLRRNPVLVGANYADVETESSAAQSDTSATSSSGGDSQFTLGLDKSGSGDFKIGDGFYIDPNDRLTVTAQATSGTVDIVCSFNWEEEY